MYLIPDGSKLYIFFIIECCFSSNRSGIPENTMYNEICHCIDSVLTSSSDWIHSKAVDDTIR